MPEDGTLHHHRCENLKFYKALIGLSTELECIITIVIVRRKRRTTIIFS
jgi:hypothetical protein